VESSSQTNPGVIDSPPNAPTQEAASPTQQQVRPQEQVQAQVQPQVESEPTQVQPAPAQPAQSLEEHVKDLRKQVERLVKAPGAPLKSAPFHTASTLQSLNPGTELIILISTPYWYGVETHEGQHGWVLRDQLEQP
jgi:hypothetical protein